MLTYNKNISYLTPSHMDPTSAEPLIILKDVFSIPCSQKPISYDIGCTVPTVSNSRFFFFNVITFIASLL